MKTYRFKGIKSFYNIFLLLSFLVVAEAVAQENSLTSEITIKKWKGFEKHTFKFENKDAWVVVPKNAVSGNPWLWRARFPQYHNQADSILSSEGFHIAHINTAEMFGSPNAMDIWDRFYDYLTTEFKLDKKVSLSGVSRGGLFIYTWAKRNPEKVNCIYADAPVCDIKSWPGGFEKGSGEKEVWNRLKDSYGFETDEQARSYANNPIDNLDVLAKAKIPILHMIGLKDEIVPAEENTFVLVNRYLRLGGSATVVPCTQGKQTLRGHHFSIETPRLVADFIKYHSGLPKAKLQASKYHTPRGGVRNALVKFKKEKKGRVAFLGGSITYNDGWRNFITTYLKERFPDTEFDFIAAGIPSTGSTPGSYRLQRDVLKNGPVDLLFVESAVNDSSNERTAEEQILAIEGIIRHARNVNRKCDIIMMYFVDQEKMGTYRKGDVPEVILNQDKVAEHYAISTINLAKEVTERIDAGEFSWEKDFINLHPSPFGQQIYYNSIRTFLEDSWKKSEVLDENLQIHEVPEALMSGNYQYGQLLSVKEFGKQKGWDYVPNWKPTDGAETRQNYTDVPMLVNEGTGKILKLNFEGDAVGIAVASGPDAGIIEFSIDGKPWIKRNLSTRWSSSLHLPWYHTLAFSLEPSKHTLRIRVLQESNTKNTGNACRIRYFFVNGTGRSK